MTDPFDALEHLRFEPPASQSPLLQDLGIAHGFEGIGRTPPRVHHARQVHGTTIADGQDSSAAPEATERVTADGLFSTSASVAVSVKTADCVPALFASRDGKAVMAVHAGWRGLTAGILAEAAAWWKEFGVKASELYVVIGPAIGREAFEVGPEVASALRSDKAQLGREAAAFCLAKGRGDRWHVDLKLAAALQLNAAGVPADHVAVMQTCTKSDASRWHSYRREGRRESSNWSWIRPGPAKDG